MTDFFRVQLGIVSRAAGHSAAKRSAYQSCSRVTDHEGRRFDFTRKAAERAIPTMVLAPNGVAPWCCDSETLWQRAGAAERRVDAQEARIVDCSMPREVPRHLWPAAIAHVYEPFRAAGMIVQVDVHDTLASDGGRNINCHGLASLRRVEGEGFAKAKERQWNDLFREGKGRIVRDLIAERWTSFCATHDIDYIGDARSNAERDRPAPEPELPRWNFEAAKRGNGSTPALSALHDHRRHRREWEQAHRELADAQVQVAETVKRLRSSRTNSIEPTTSAAKTVARRDRRAAAFRAWYGGGWLDADELRGVASFRMDEAKRCLFIDLHDGSTLIDTGISIRLRGKLTWAVAVETAAAADRHGWSAVNVYGSQDYKDAVAIACALRGISVANYVLSPGAQANLEAKRVQQAKETSLEDAPRRAMPNPFDKSRGAFLRILENRRNNASDDLSEEPDVDGPSRVPGYRFRFSGKDAN